MGVGKKVETLGKKSPYQLTSNINPYSARNLMKKDLGGVIFGCSHSTFKECIFKQLFGLPASHIHYVQNVTPGLPVFLFNYSDRTLHGIFEATTAGQMYIDGHAWTCDDQDSTPFPAQVRVKIRKQCRPLREDQYKPIIAKNYLKHEPRYLWFELDELQTYNLISCFSTCVVAPHVSLPSTAAKRGTLLRLSAAPVVQQGDMNQGLSGNSIRTVTGEEKSVVLLDQGVAKDQENSTSAVSGKKWTSLFKPQSNPFPSKEHEDISSEGHSTMSEDEPFVVPEATPHNKTPVAISELIDEAENLTDVSETTCLAEETSVEGNSNLREVVNKLILEVRELKALHVRQIQKIQNLELELEEANSKSLKSVNCQKSVGPGPSHSASQLEETHTEIQDVCQSILLVGGFDGSSWLQSLDSYCPFEEFIRPLSHMKSVRSYASAVELDDKLYILGGRSGSSWYDSVESYDLKRHQWVTCPSLNRKKGIFATASLEAKIFAIGGGNSTDCFSEVEVLDLHVGKWIAARSMAEERYAPAASELNGVLYVTGGYDGQNYLSSVESFDPRASSWMRLNSMKSRRGCHSLIVLNEKLYAIGGYDGTQMVPCVEVFEPRIGSWTMSKPMIHSRGFMGTVNFGEKIYVIGGMRENDDILDTFECYSEAEGWKLVRPKYMRKICFLTAVTV